MPTFGLQCRLLYINVSLHSHTLILLLVAPLWYAVITTECEVEHLMPFVIVQEINPKHLTAPRDVYKPGSVHDIP